MDPVPSPRGKMYKKASAEMIGCHFEPTTQELDDRKEADLTKNEWLADELKSDVLPKQEVITDEKGRQKTVPLIYNTKVKSTAAPMRKYKTKMCPDLPYCLRGAHCRYAHSPDELAMYTKLDDECLTPYYRKAKHVHHAEFCNNQQCPVKLRLLLCKTVICKYWKEGDCHKGKQCRHAHGNGELRPLPKYELCKRHLQRECNLRNDQCVYAHGRGELRKNSPFNKDALASTQAIAGVSHGYLEQTTDVDNDSRLCSLCSDLFRQIPEEIRSRYIILAIDTLGLQKSKSFSGLHGQVIQMNPPPTSVMKLSKDPSLRSVELMAQTVKSFQKSGSNQSYIKTKAVAESGLNTQRESAKVVKRSGSENIVSERKRTSTQSESEGLQNIPQDMKPEIKTLDSLKHSVENNFEDSAFSTDESDCSNSEEEEEDDCDKLDEEMERILDTHQVKCYQLFHLPNKRNKIEVSGSGVTPLKEKLVSTAKKYNYTVVVKELDFPTTSQTGPVTSNWILLCRGNFALASKENENSHISAMEVIVQAKDKRRQRDQLDYFGVTTAHSFLDKEDNDKLMASSETFLEVVNRVATEHVRLNYYMNVPKKVAIDFTGNPLPLYRYWRREGVCCEWSALQDVALVRLDREQVRSDGLLNAGNLDVNENLQVPPFGDIDLRHIQCDGKGRRILCSQKSGILIRPPKVKDNGHILGVHLAFTLDDGECLKPGDCGSAVYLDGRRPLPLIGMFFGCMKGRPHIHQAVLLSWNLKLVEKVPEFKIQEIKLAEDEGEETDI